MLVANMVETLPVIDALHQKSSVTAIALHPTSGHLLIGNTDGLVQCVDVRSKDNGVLSKVHVNSKIVALAWSTNKIVILDEMNGLHVYSMDAEEIWTSEFDAGGAQLCVGQQILALDGIGTLRQYTLDGQEYSTTQRDVRSFAMSNDATLLVLENQTVAKTDDQLNIVFHRMQRGEIGEDIVAAGAGAGQTWFVAREGHALVPGEEEALELEVYSNENLLHRRELRGRVKATAASVLSLYLGLDNGDLLSLNNHELEDLISFDYPIQSLHLNESTLIIGTWFYIYGFDIETKSIIWQVEHKGMVEGIEIDDSGCMAFFGDDQNDWTGAEPVGICDLNQERIEVDPTFLQGWFEEEMVEVETNPEIVYRNVDDFTNLLSEEEQQSYEQSMQELVIGLDSLTAAMNEEISSQSVDDTEDDLDELLQFLHEDADEVILPKANAGENQTIRLHDAETVIVTLDGSQSSDPQDRIQSWSWLDGTGREISTEAKVRVKLSPGIHQFELRVFDSEGGMTSDSLQITIESSGS
ncbi:MAG: Uncharacterised protein [Candidatus Poseidoniaceae archaeon]|nr:MAG: Uncharacterised protein [Candidatus Poseidoniaceae archaeon]